MAESPCFWTLEQQAEALERRELSSRELVSAYLSRIEAVNPALNAFVLVMGGQAMGLAFERDQERASGEEQPRLHGIPIAIKDLFDFKAGVRNTFGSVPLKDFVPSESSTYVQRLEEAGAIVLGKTNTPEFGHKGITDSPLLGPCSTPFKVGFNAGGSSGGSASRWRPVCVQGPKDPMAGFNPDPCFMVWRLWLQGNVRCCSQCCSTQWVQ